MLGLLDFYSGNCFLECVVQVSGLHTDASSEGGDQDDVSQVKSPAVEKSDASSEGGDEDDVSQVKISEDPVEKFGAGLALLILCVGLLFAGMWLFASQSFEKCSAIENLTERNACYEQLRLGRLKPPAKGGDFRY